MRAKNDISYHEYKEGVHDKFNLLLHGFSDSEPYQLTDSMVEEDAELFVGTSIALWMISLAEYEVRHNILEDRVLEQVSYHIHRYEMGKYTDISDEEKEELEADIEFIKSHVKIYDKEDMILDDD